MQPHTNIQTPLVSDINLNPYKKISKHRGQKCEAYFVNKNKKKDRLRAIQKLSRKRNR